MIAFFGICAFVGVFWLVLESAARSTSVAPSMYRTSGNGWILILIAVIGAICVSYLR